MRVRGVLCQGLCDPNHLGLAIESLTAFLMIALNALARVALRGIAPRTALARQWDTRQREHLGGAGKDSICPDWSARFSNLAVHVSDVATMDGRHFLVLA